MKLYVNWVLIYKKISLFTYIGRNFQNSCTGLAVVREPWPGGIRGGYLNPLIHGLKRLNPKGRRIDVRSTAADPLKASWIVSVFARACDRSGFGYLGPLESMISLI